jgi:hydroxypyruvate isomerase
MPDFAANLSFMFNEWDFLDRFQAAADAGFTAVEYLFPYEHAPDAIAARLDKAGLTQALFNLPPGDWAAGVRPPPLALAPGELVAVVGPNGSGKSNVAEAFRFVLGEQSIKSLRGKRGEDLIYNGGATATRLNRASVRLVFDNRKRLFNIDFDEVSIERVIHRDSASEYFING